MAIMSVRATYALDRETAESIRRLAGRWRTSQAEVIRRAVRSAAEQSHAEPEPMTPMDVIAHYRKAKLPRSAAQTRALIAKLRAQRHADDGVRAGKLGGKA